MDTTSHISLRLRRFLNPKAIVFGACVLNFLISLMFVRRVELEAQAAMAAGYWGYSEHWNPVAVMWEPFLLLLASVALLVNRWWSLVLALLASGRVVYLLGYLSWRAIHFAHDVPMLSWQAVEKLWYVIYSPRPQYLIELLIAGSILVYAILAVGRLLYLKSRAPIVGG